MPVINILFEIIRHLAPLTSGFEAEIMERHHSLKKDSPSGTALAILDSWIRALPEDVLVNPVFARDKGINERKPGELGVFALRQGGVTGEHSLYLSSQEEEIVITHRAFTRQVFASGAVRAAYWLSSQKAGLYTFSDVLNT